LKNATVAQLAEQTIRNRQVVGSYPTGGSKHHQQPNDWLKTLIVWWLVRKIEKFRGPRNQTISMADGIKRTIFHQIERLFIQPEATRMKHPLTLYQVIFHISQ
jgi:hypothetical protein